ncbi:MAG: electron transport complex subunit RsxG [Gallionella sp.]|nr:electron transport complex subunit RsxG [Gallionella sp.]
MQPIFKASMQTSLRLLMFTVVGTAALAFTFNITHDKIAASEEAEKLNLIKQIVPQEKFDNQIMQDTLSIAADPLLGNNNATTAYRGRLQSQPSVLVLEAIAPDGYSGKIRFIMALQYDGTISGVRVVKHKETPGLGDYIDAAKSYWIKGFNGISLTNRTDKDWKVKKDGGQFDYMTGATISPRAMIKAVHKASQYYAQHRDELFAQQTVAPSKE